MKIDDWTIYICAEVVDPHLVLSPISLAAIKGENPNPMLGVDVLTLCGMSPHEVVELQEKIKSWNEIRAVNVDAISCYGYALTTMPGSGDDKIYLVFYRSNATLTPVINDHLTDEYRRVGKCVRLGPLYVRVEYDG